MTSRADMDTVSGDVRCRVVTDRKTIEFVLPPLEALALADAIKDYAGRVLHRHVTEIETPATRRLTRWETGR